MSRGGSVKTWCVVLDCCILQIAFRRVNIMHRQQIRRGNGRGTLACLKPHICSWWLSHSLWPCRRDTGSQWSFLWEAPGAPCKLSYKRTKKHHSGLYRCKKLFDKWKEALPNVRHSIPVLIICCPDGYFISFCTDVDHGSAHIVTVVIEGLTDQTQELQNSSSSARQETNENKGWWSQFIWAF